jgi:hypothetical protein
MSTLTSTAFTAPSYTDLERISSSFNAIHGPFWFFRKVLQLMALQQNHQLCGYSPATPWKRFSFACRNGQGSCLEQSLSLRNGAFRKSKRPRENAGSRASRMLDARP